MLRHENDEGDSGDPLHWRRREDEDLERDERAARHFPHLSASVAPRESDEYPTFWEE